MSTTPLELQAGALRLSLRPDLGACIAGFWHGDTLVLRSPDPADLKTARLSGSFPLVPYSNRVGYRRFEWLGLSHTTAPNFDDNPHSVHGVSWQRPWAVVDAGADQAELVHRHSPDEHWPFAYEARQRFALTPQGLTVHLSVVNLAPHDAPLGLGWHPYFPKRERSRLDIEVNARWLSDAAGLPTHTEPVAGIHAPVAELDFDNCFAGFQGVAHIEDERLRLKLTSDLPWLVVFTPDTKPYYCVEPVSHVSNAIQMADPAAHGLVAVPPQGRIEGWMRLDVAAV